MELRVLRYFLAVANEASFTGAAEVLHVTQPTLSKQLMDLEKELGTKLFIRGNRKISLTNEGRFLQRRAKEIVSLADKTKAEFSDKGEMISGDICIGGGETDGMSIIGKVIKQLRSRYPDVKYHLFSGNSIDVSERLDKGLLDFGVFVAPVNVTKYDYIKLPDKDIWGLLMRNDSPLAKNKTIQSKDLINLPLIVSRQTVANNEFSGWIGKNIQDLNIECTYNLLYNASLLVEENVGYALCLDRIIRDFIGSVVTFRPLEPKMEVDLVIAWKKHQMFSKASENFLELLKEEISNTAI